MHLDLWVTKSIISKIASVTHRIVPDLRAPVSLVALHTMERERERIRRRGYIKIKKLSRTDKRNYVYYDVTST